jgi:hypothetical protein
MAIPQGKFTGFQAQGLWPTMLGVSLNRNSFLKAWQVGSVTFTSAAVGANSITEQAIVITGITINDLVLVMSQTNPTANVGNMGTARVLGGNSLQVRYINPTAGSLTPTAASVLFFLAFQVQ